jgi:hypothetical protein
MSLFVTSERCFVIEKLGYTRTIESERPHLTVNPSRALKQQFKACVYAKAESMLPTIFGEVEIPDTVYTSSRYPLRILEIFQFFLNFIT